MELKQEVKESIVSFAKSQCREYSINMKDYYEQIFPIEVNIEKDLAVVDIIFNHIITNKSIKVKEIVFRISSGEVLQFKNIELN